MEKNVDFDLLFAAVNDLLIAPSFHLFSHRGHYPAAFVCEIVAP
jgi:hypothetical protein